MKLGILLLTFILSAKALVPLEGIVYGDIRDIRQYDPLRGLFNEEIIYQNKNLSDAQRTKIEKYKALYAQAVSLKNSCDQNRFFIYENVWDEALAKRSVVATLQYIGLDLTSKAIASYAKNFNIAKPEYENLVNNLVVNNCSKNISVFSHKLIKNNLMKLYESENIEFSFPNLKGSPYFTQNIIDKTQSRESKKKEFNIAIKNFRALCSWGGDTENYRLLPPYLKNPYLMSYVFNHMIKRKIIWDKKDARAYLEKEEDTVQVACEDLICRRRNYAGFNKLYPRMVGSNSVEDDLKVLYCNHFRDTTFKTLGLDKKLKNIINKKEIAQSYIEPMNLVSFITGVPDILVGSDKFKDIQRTFNDSIEYRWDNWAKSKSGQLITELLYEESLFVDLDKVASDQYARRGRFQMIFDFTLGELDRVLRTSDKVSSRFDLVFPKSYLKWVRSRYIRANNKSEYDVMDALEKKFATYIGVQLTKKKEYFSTKLWNEKFRFILAKNLIEQIVNYQGGFFNDFEKNKVKIPIKFRFGLFALRYIREKYKSKLDLENLTLKKPTPSYKR